MYRKLTVLLALLFSISLASSPLASAQADPDIDAIGESVLATDPEALVEALETADIDSMHLPEAIIPPTDEPDATPEDADPEASPEPGGVLAGEPAEGAVGSHGMAFEVDTDVLPGLINFAALDIIVFDEAVDDGEGLEAYREAIEAGFAELDEQDLIPEVEDVVVGDDSDALLIALTDEEEFDSVQMLTLPVGNVFVIATVVVSDVEPVDVELANDVTEELVLGAAEHVGDVAESAGQ